MRESKAQRILRGLSTSNLSFRTEAKRQREPKQRTMATMSPDKQTVATRSLDWRHTITLQMAQ